MQVWLPLNWNYRLTRTEKGLQAILLRVLANLSLAPIAGEKWKDIPVMKAVTKLLIGDASGPCRSGQNDGWENPDT
jgi:hypothetical protein